MHHGIGNLRRETHHQRRLHEFKLSIGQRGSVYLKLAMCERGLRLSDAYLQLGTTEFV
jgi:hypothetical protein